MKHRISTLALALLATPLAAHHSDAGLNMNTIETVEGTVTEFAWRNPHIYIAVESTNDAGEPVEWEFQMGGITPTMRMGWDRNSLQAGERVIIEAHAALDGRPYGLMRTVEKEGGVRLPTRFDSGSAEPVVPVEETDARATSLEGLWIADMSTVVSYPGGYDGLYRAHLTLTEKGLAAQEALDELSFDNPEAGCLVRPAPGMIISTNLYPIGIEYVGDDIIMLRSEYFDDERTVYMDGRGHPENGPLTIDGHSIGHWEGDVLVVDTANFAFHRSPYQMGVPSDNQKHVVERYELIADGGRLRVEFTLEDPEYLVGSMTHSRELIYSPDWPVNRWDCDADTSSRFVPQ